jgi:hypothetical protein
MWKNLEPTFWHYEDPHLSLSTCDERDDLYTIRKWNSDMTLFDKELEKIGVGALP